MTATVRTTTFKTTLTVDMKKTYARQAKQFVAALKKIMKDSGLTPAELARGLEIPPRTLQTWLAGTSLPPPERIEQVTLALRAEAEQARAFADAVTASL